MVSVLIIAQSTAGKLRSSNLTRLMGNQCKLMGFVSHVYLEKSPLLFRKGTPLQKKTKPRTFESDWTNPPSVTFNVP